MAEAHTMPALCHTDRVVGGTTVVELRGEIDLLTAQTLAARLDALTAGPCPDLVLDLRPVVLVRAGEEPEDEHLPDHEGNASTRTPPCHEVVLGLDLADPCDEVIGFAFEAAQVRGATLHAVSTWTGPSPLSLGPGEIGLLDPLQLDEEWRGFLSAVLQPWREKFPDVEVSQTVTEGKAGARLVYASSGASLLVVGHRIRGAALGFRTGPVTHTVIHHANCPIAVVAHD